MSWPGVMSICKFKDSQGVSQHLRGKNENNNSVFTKSLMCGGGGRSNGVGGRCNNNNSNKNKGQSRQVLINVEEDLKAILKSIDNL